MPVEEAVAVEQQAVAVAQAVAVEEQSAPVEQCAVVEHHHGSLLQVVVPPAQLVVPPAQQPVAVEQQAVAVRQDAAVGQAASVAVAFEILGLPMDRPPVRQAWNQLPMRRHKVPPAQHMPSGASQTHLVEKQEDQLVFPLWLSELAAVPLGMLAYLLVKHKMLMLDRWAHPPAQGAVPVAVSAVQQAVVVEEQARPPAQPSVSLAEMPVASRGCA